MSALAGRLAVVSGSRPELGLLVERLTTDALDLAPPHAADYSWSTFVAMYCLPLAEPLLKDGVSPKHLDAVLGLQVATLVAERTLDDVTEHGGDPNVVQAINAELVARAEHADIQLAAFAPSAEPRSARHLLDGWRRAPLLIQAASAAAGVLHPRWARGYRSLVSLTVLLDDVEDVLEDVRAGRDTPVTALLSRENWSPADVAAGMRVSRALAEARAQLCLDSADSADHYPLLAAVVTAASPSGMRDAMRLATATHV